MTRGSVLLTAGIACAWALPAPAADAISDYVAAAVNDPGRPVPDIEADATNKSAALLAFSGITSGMVVAEFFPPVAAPTRACYPSS